MKLLIGSHNPAKIKYYTDYLGDQSDDGGFEIDYLNGQPGIKSRRWLGYKMTDQELIDEAMKRLKGVAEEKRGAALKCIIAICDSKQCQTFDCAISGTIPLKAYLEIEEGFPFRSTLWIPEVKKYYIELTREEKDKLDHRKKVIPEIKQYLKS